MERVGSKERIWAKEFGTLKVRVVLEFKDGYLILPTGGQCTKWILETYNFS